MNLPPRVIAAPPGRAPAAAASKRDLRLDFFRGLSLFFIYIDHIPGIVFAYFTLHAIAFCDAAEVFIFISGYTAALVYGQSLRRNGSLFATAQIYRRVWQLYVAHVFLFVIFVIFVTLIAAQGPLYSDALGVGDFLREPHVAIIHALMLDFQPRFLDILPLYIVLLGLFPFILQGLRRNPWVACGVSAAIYALTLRRGWALHTFPTGDVWFFNPFAWQFLFTIGAAFGLRGDAKVPPWLSGAAAAAASLITVITLTWMAHFFYDPFPPLFLNLWYLTLDKTDLAPLRLFSFLALAGTAFHFVRRDSGFLHARAARLVILCGQNSLYVFCVGIILSVLAHFVLSEISADLGMQTAVTLAGAGIMIATAAMAQWFKRLSRLPPRVAAAE